jgi:hypothetical protein
VYLDTTFCDPRFYQIPSRVCFPGVTDMPGVMSLLGVVGLPGVVTWGVATVLLGGYSCPLGCDYF